MIPAWDRLVEKLHRRHVTVFLLAAGVLLALTLLDL